MKLLDQAVVREKGLSASARRLDLEAQFNASGYGDRKGRHYYMIGTAARDNRSRRM